MDPNQQEVDDCFFMLEGQGFPLDVGVSEKFDVADDMLLPVDSDSPQGSPESIFLEGSDILGDEKSQDLEWMSELLSGLEKDFIQSQETKQDNDAETVPLVSEFGDSDGVVPSFVSSNMAASSTVSSAESSIVSDKDLLTLSTKDLNRRLQNVSEEDKKALKHRRRTLKNRGYARNCRSKRIVHKTEIEQCNLSLHDQVMQLKESVAEYEKENKELRRERDVYKHQRDHLLVKFASKAKGSH